MTGALIYMDIRIILNGKKAGLAPVRAAITSARESSRVDVRVTWEAGDVHRLVQEACADGCRRLVAGGGDGTVNEIVDAILALAPMPLLEKCVRPLCPASRHLLTHWEPAVDRHRLACRYIRLRRSLHFVRILRVSVSHPDME